MPDPPEPPEEKKPFNWGKLTCNVLAGLAVVAAVTATVALVAVPVVGATTNAFESIVRQKLNGQDIDLEVVAGDGIFGGLTGGLFHYGGKALKSGFNYVKKSISRVLSENESSLMKLAKNLDDMLRTIKVEVLQMRTSNGINIPVDIRAIRGESRDAVQNTVSKIVGKAKSNIVSDVNDLLTSTSKFTKSMAKELEEGVQNNKFRVRALNNDGYELSD